MPSSRTVITTSYHSRDSSVITPEVEKLRDKYNHQGIRIQQFAFGTDPMSHPPEKYVANCVAYSGTHDNDTVVGWFSSKAGEEMLSSDEIEAERKVTLDYFGTDGSNIHWDFIQSIPLWRGRGHRARARYSWSWLRSAYEYSWQALW